MKQFALSFAPEYLYAFLCWTASWLWRLPQESWRAASSKQKYRSSRHMKLVLSCDDLHQLHEREGSRTFLAHIRIRLRAPCFWYLPKNVCQILFHPFGRRSWVQRHKESVLHLYYFIQPVTKDCMLGTANISSAVSERCLIRNGGGSGLCFCCFQYCCNVPKYISRLPVEFTVL